MSVPIGNFNEATVTFYYHRMSSLLQDTVELTLFPS